MLRIERDGRVATIWLDHAPMNLLDIELMLALDGATAELATDDGVSVVVLRSAIPGWFIAHADVALLLQLDPSTSGPPAEGVGFFHLMVERLRTMPKLVIAAIEGVARGGGSEVALSCDVRIASLDAVLGQPEVALGILPGGGGTQRLARLAGRARALEVVLGCDDLDGATAERWGWVNRALPPAEVGPFVDRLAARVAAYPPQAVAEAKAAVDAALPDPVPGLRAESAGFATLLGSDEARRRMQGFLDGGGQTTAVEGNPERFQALLGEISPSGR
jgi:enoyl-CoA hydratase/carnithine racemase